MPLVARYGAATVAMTIDEDGMARTAAKKLEVAKRIAQIANDEYGVPNEALVYDVLTLEGSVASRAHEGGTAPAQVAKAIAAAHGLLPPLDISVKADAEKWARRLHGADAGRRVRRALLRFGEDAQFHGPDATGARGR